jgi:hypothetical protein
MVIWDNGIHEALFYAISCINSRAALEAEDATEVALPLYCAALRKSVREAASSSSTIGKQVAKTAGVVPNEVPREALVRRQRRARTP